ncbi:peptidase C39-like protein [Terracoccus luteus]|uniref:Peptidase C39-like protein n=1 Tax=Terracoccus luteus TaxID=53356 RepID=A0A495XWQ4_9MICO|nr:peptidase C39-like protein [Terracoccus luteus]
MTLTVWEDELDWLPAEPVEHTDAWVEGAGPVRWSARRWESPVVDSTFEALELVPSWNAQTPAGTWLLVEGRVLQASGWSPWLTFARWTDAGVDPDHGGGAMVRTTVKDQPVEGGRMAHDAFVADPASPFSAWQVRLTALSERDHGPWPTVSLVAACVSAVTVGADEPTSRPGVARGVEIAVPPHSQRLHVDTFAHWDEGGQSWCSPTSTTMLLEHWGHAPTADETAWVGDRPDPAVVHAVSRVYDAAFAGAGNWAFNAAYAATRGLRAYVTRLRDLTEVEAFVAAGVPVVVSVAFEPEQLDGAGYGTSGHLLTVVGFTPEGDVVSNDPNSHRIPSNDEVRTVYRRDQFERVWLGTNGGMTYVMHPADHPLPPPPAEANWA